MIKIIKPEEKQGVSGIVVEYKDGTSERMQKGCCINLKDDEHISMRMMHADTFDILRITYGFFVMVNEMGMMEQLETFFNGKLICDKEEDKEDEHGI